MSDTKQVELDKAIEELNVLNTANPQDSDAIAKANTKVDALRKALTEPEVKPVKPVEPFKVESPFKKF